MGSLDGDEGVEHKDVSEAMLQNRLIVNKNVKLVL